jgi:hypothetical protein
MSEEEVSRYSQVERFEKAVQRIGLVAAPLTLITALLFYIGWARTDQVYEYFGVDLSLVGLSNQDYILRSVEGIYIPLGIILVLAFCGLLLHSFIRRFFVQARRRRAVLILGWILLSLGASAFLVGAIAVARPTAIPVYTLFVPLLLGLGIVALYYGRWLLRCFLGMRAQRPSFPARSPVELTLVSLLLVLSMFWAASEFAAAVGRGGAASFASGAGGRPDVVIYSAQRLFLNAPGVIEEPLPEQSEAAYRYKYSGLRLLSESKNRLFLLPAVWTPGTITFMIDYGPGMRIEFVSRARR